jgi:hypothetical protein
LGPLICFTSLLYATAQIAAGFLENKKVQNGLRFINVARCRSYDGASTCGAGILPAFLFWAQRKSGPFLRQGKQDAGATNTCHIPTTRRGRFLPLCLERDRAFAAADTTP